MLRHNQNECIFGFHRETSKNEWENNVDKEENTRTIKQLTEWGEKEREGERKRSKREKQKINRTKLRSTKHKIVSFIHFVIVNIRENTSFIACHFTQHQQLHSTRIDSIIFFFFFYFFFWILHTICTTADLLCSSKCTTMWKMHIQEMLSKRKIGFPVYIKLSAIDISMQWKKKNCKLTSLKLVSSELL